MPTTTPEIATPAIATASIPLGTQVISILFMLGTIRGALLLLKDAKKHKGFAKIIRMISGIVSLLSIAGSIVVMLIALTTLQGATGKGFLVMMLLFSVLGFISIITNIRGGILLFKESGKNKGFDKRIRIITGTIMILSIAMSLILGM